MAFEARPGFVRSIRRGIDGIINGISRKRNGILEALLHTGPHAVDTALQFVEEGLRLLLSDQLAGHLLIRKDKGRCERQEGIDQLHREGVDGRANERWELERERMEKGTCLGMDDGRRTMDDGCMMTPLAQSSRSPVMR